MPTVGNIIVEAWTVLDGADAPLTGMTSPGDVTFDLQRQSGSTMIAATEVVAWAEVGVTGRYYFSFTPENSGRYVLYGSEIGDAPLARRFEFRWDVVSAGAVFSATYADAFCAETDVETWTQTAIDATTEPSDSEAAQFAEHRADMLVAICASAGYSVTPATVTAGSVIEGLLRRANAIGTALDYTVAQQFGVGRPNLSERVERYQILWNETVFGTLVGKQMIGGLVTELGNLASLSSDHIISGDTAAAASASVQGTDTGITIGMGSLF